MIKSFLKRQSLSPDAIHLFAHYIVRLIGTGLLGIFGTIYIFQLFYRVEPILIYYIGIFMVVFFCSPIVMWLVNKIGFKKAMIQSLFFLSGAYLSLYAAQDSQLPSIWLSVSGILHAIFIMLYWVPYHTDFTLLTTPKMRGHNLALLTAGVSTVAIVLPIISSAIISSFNFGILFVLSTVIILYSIVYLKKTPEINEHFSFSYIETYKQLFSKKNRRLLLAYSGSAVQDIIGAVIWPIFIFLLLEGNYYSVGIITALITMASIVLQLITGSLADRFSKTKIVKFSASFHSIGWIIKSIVQTPFQIFAAGAYHDLTKSASQVSFDTLMYQQAGASKHYIDEYSVLRQISQALGRTLAMLLSLFLIQFIGIKALFWLAAVTSLFMGLL